MVKISKKQDITCGIPQGSCLGPLLFILYKNDFEKSQTRSCLNMYADDTSISFSSENLLLLLENLKRELEGILDWLRQNKLSLNVAKCEYMFLGNNKQLNKTSQIESLSWTQQYKIVKGKLKGGLNSIRKLREILPQSQLFLVYQALVESHLRYENLMWGHFHETKLCTLQKMQNRAFYLIESY